MFLSLDQKMRKQKKEIAIDAKNDMIEAALIRADLDDDLRDEQTTSKLAEIYKKTMEKVSTKEVPITKGITESFTSSRARELRDMGLEDSDVLDETDQKKIINKLISQVEKQKKKDAFDKFASNASDYAYASKLQKNLTNLQFNKKIKKERDERKMMAMEDAASQYRKDFEGKIEKFEKGAKDGRVFNRSGESKFLYNPKARDNKAIPDKKSARKNLLM